MTSSIIGSYIATLTDGSKCAVSVHHDFHDERGQLVHVGLVKNAQGYPHIIFFNQAGKLTDPDDWIAGDLEHIVAVKEVAS